MTETRVGYVFAAFLVAAVLTCWHGALPAQQLEQQLQEQLKPLQQQLEVVLRADKETTNAALYGEVRKIWQEQNQAELQREMNDPKVRVEFAAECFPKDVASENVTTAPANYPLRIAAELAYTKMAVAQGRIGDLVESALSASPVYAWSLLLATAQSKDTAAVVKAVEPITSHPCVHTRLAAVAVLQHLAKRDGVAAPAIPVLSAEDQEILDRYNRHIVQSEILASPDPRAALARMKAMRAGSKPTTASPGLH